MTSRTDDYHCPRCRRYLFSAYTVHMSREEREALRRDAATACKCPSKPPADGVTGPDGETKPGAHADE